MLSEQQEQIIREVQPIGNGAHVFTPKEWLGERVILVRTKKTLKEEILSTLEPYLENIEGAYLYGSHARKESTRDSDIDLLVITTKKMKIKKEGYEIITLEKSEMDKAIKISPIIIYSALKEAQPIINASLLEKLKENHKLSQKEIKEEIEKTKDLIQINKELIEKETSKEMNPEGIAYSLILRLKSLLIIKSLKSNEPYSNKNLIQLMKNSVDEYTKIYESYKATKHNKKINLVVKKSSLESLIKLVEKELK